MVVFFVCSCEFKSQSNFMRLLLFTLAILVLVWARNAQKLIEKNNLSVNIFIPEFLFYFGEVNREDNQIYRSTRFSRTAFATKHSNNQNFARSQNEAATLSKKRYNTGNIGPRQIEKNAKLRESNVSSCVPRIGQTTAYPSCNILHELGWGVGIGAGISLRKGSGNVMQDGERTNNKITVLGWGGSRTSYLVQSMLPYYASVVIKGPHFGKDEMAWYEKQNRDAIILEKATASPFIPDIYGFCGLNVVMEYSDGGSIHDYLRASRYNATNRGTYVQSTTLDKVTFNVMDKLRVGHQVASGVAAFHEIAGDASAPAFAHNDICCHQFLFFRGSFKLNDFDHAKILRISQDTGAVCHEPSHMKLLKMRSPEEMRFAAVKKGIMSSKDVSAKFALHKIDVYLTGNVLYYILTNKYLFEGFSRDDAVKKLMSGERPLFFGAENYTHPAIRALVRATKMCWEDDPRKRSTSREIADYLEMKLMGLDQYFRETRVNQV